MIWMRRYWAIAVLVVLLGLNATAFLQRQTIADWWRLRDYQPPASIVKLADNAAMAGEGRHYFYINHPVLEDKEGFNMHCADRDEETAVLGCYHGNRQGIYLYNVTDERLQGVQEVTAAHEMLHQAYDRLSVKERDHVNNLLQQLYQSGELEPAIMQKIDSYKKQKDAVLTNEMHSIFGSEVRTLTPELEQYYTQYFTDRSKVVSLSEAYRAEFTRREQLVTQYDTQLADLGRKITTSRADLDRRMAELNAKEQEINDAFARRDVPAYKAAIADYNKKVEAYNAKVSATRSLIADYNAIVAKRNDIAVEEQQLQQALDSQQQATPKQ